MLLESVSEKNLLATLDNKPISSVDRLILLCGTRFFCFNFGAKDLDDLAEENSKIILYYYTDDWGIGQ